jgi:hypothetical protein
MRSGKNRELREGDELSLRGEAEQFFLRWPIERKITATGRQNLGGEFGGLPTFNNPWAGMEVISIV